MNTTFVDGTRLVSVVEALIFASSEPLPAQKILDLLNENEEELKIEIRHIEQVVQELNERYDSNDLAFRIERLGGGYTFVTQSRFHPWLQLSQHEAHNRRLSQSSLETLAIIAYKQPITKPEVDDIRGVDSGYVIRQLLEKTLIKVSGRASTPGKPLLYKTTDSFLSHFGINHVNELPRPREIDDILKDDDMAEHRQTLLDYGSETADENVNDELGEQSTDALSDDLSVESTQQMSDELGDTSMDSIPPISDEEE